MNEAFRYDVLNNETILKMKILLKTKLFISWKFTILKIHKNFTICVEFLHSTQYTLANFNLHQRLISFLYMVPSCKHY